MTTIENKRSRVSTALLVVAAGLFGVLVLSFLVPRMAPWSPPEVTCDTSVINPDSKVHFYTLDGNGVDDAGDTEAVLKEVAYAFGPNADKGFIQGDLDELCLRMTNDPSLVAGAEAAFGYVPATAEATGAEERKMLDDHTYWKSVVDRILADIKAMAHISTQPVSAGSPSLYMVPNADNSFIDLNRGSTSRNGTILLFTRADGSTVKLRLDCGFQPIFETPPTGFPECTGEGCSNPCPHGVNSEGNCIKSHADDVTPAGPWTVITTPGTQTTGNESEEQQESGDTSGNVTDNQVSSNTTSGSTTSDTGGNVSVGGASTGGDDKSNDVVDHGNTNQDTTGTGGDTQIGVPAD